MKYFGKAALLLIAILTLSLLAGCQEKKITSGDKTGRGEIKPASKVDETAIDTETKLVKGGAKLEFESDVYDFGKLSPKDKAKGTFKFKNSGTATLLISRIKSSCGCTVVDQAKIRNKSFEPGESGSFDITYTAGVKPGPVVKNITIYSNSVGKPAYVCRLKAQIVVAVNVEPKRFNLLFRKENAGISPITLKSTDGEAFKIVSFTSTGETVKVDFDPNEEALEFVLQPKVDLTKFTGKMLRGVINITLSHPKAKSIRINYSIKPLWVTSPPKFILMEVKRGTSSQRSLLIKSNYGEKVEIESVSSQKKYIKVISQEQDGNSVRMKVEIKIPAKEEMPQRFIKDTLEIELKTGETLEVGCLIYPRKV